MYTKASSHHLDLPRLAATMPRAQGKREPVAYCFLPNNFPKNPLFSLGS
jgi:hypothetical protein